MKRQTRRSWQGQKDARVVQQAIWDAAVKAQQDWNAKPRAEQLADARYVQRWAPELAKSVMAGYMWMTEALAEAKKVEELCIECGVSGPDDLLALMLEAEARRSAGN